MLPHLSKDSKVVNKLTGDSGTVIGMLVCSHDVEYDIKLESGKVLYRNHGLDFEEV